MAVPAALVQLVQPWASLYNDSKVLSSGVMFAHLSGLLLGGGGAVAADRDTIRTSRTSEEEQRAHLADLRAVHRIVLTGLIVSFVSGLLMLAADIEALAGSAAFWIKMGLIGLLLVNGTAMVRAERRVAPGLLDGWARLRVASRLSLTLWFAIVLVSTLLTSS